MKYLLTMKTDGIFTRIARTLSTHLARTAPDVTKKEENPTRKNQLLQHSPISFIHLYKFATALDTVYIVMGIVFCALSGLIQTRLFLVLGNVNGLLIDYVQSISNDSSRTTIAEQKLMQGLYAFLYVICGLGTANLVSTYLFVLLFKHSALRQTYKMKNLFLAAVLNQDISWHDINQTGDFASRMAEDITKIQDGIGEKAAYFIFYVIVGVAAFLQALVKGWKLALICLISLPISITAMTSVSYAASKFSTDENKAYGDAGAIAEETFTSIRTVVAFDGQKIEHERYNTCLISARNNNIKRSLFFGINNGIHWFFSFANYALGFWYGVSLILSERHLVPEQVTYTPANVITILLSIIASGAAFSVGRSFFESLIVARGAASKIFAVIDCQSKINESKGYGLRPEKIVGEISFQNVYFCYPSRTDVQILNDLSFTVAPGETIALVGSSGCGKSTCIQLVQRYYDPDEGNIYIDGNDIKDLDLNWLRSNIGVVGQEPVLFEATIEENIRFGYKDATKEDILRAANKANAHLFICSLPNGYDTLVGERGGQLSGGQKQRIAIARALVREPSILLLDEATSALDTASESLVHAALDTASKERTTIIIAHRLSTVRKADRILMISDGKVVEEGSHDHLMSKNGVYCKLVSLQMASSEDVNEDTLPSEDKEVPVLLERQMSVESLESSKLLADKEVEKYDQKPSSNFINIMKFNRPERWIITIGCIAAIVGASGVPVFSIVYGDVISNLAIENAEFVLEQTDRVAIYMVVIAIIIGISSFLQVYMFSIAGEKLTKRLRSEMFKSMVFQEIGWFDDKNNGVGSLCSRLSGDATHVLGATGQKIGVVLNSISSIAIAMIISFCFEWHIALVLLAFCPAVFLFLFIERKLMKKEIFQDNVSLQRSIRIGVEAVSNIRTVASLGCEQMFHDRYMGELNQYQIIAARANHYRGLIYGLLTSVIYFAQAATYFYGGILIKDGIIDLKPFFVATRSLISSTWILISALGFTTDVGKGLSAAERIFNLLRRCSKIQSGSGSPNEKLVQENINCNNVHFAYPNRPNTKVLKGLNLSVPQGKIVALVGPSGCGKSTIVQLLERFYDPDSGAIYMNGRNIKEMHLSALRYHLGIVSQEPNLFTKTIAENIAYGDNSRKVTFDEIVQAAKTANIHNFIISLPLGYDTKLGEKGTQLSGGQKQRVAIARALIRNPRVLLLDEATSALDAESEKVVQEALDKAQVGRTCITIAHRLSTIESANVICVVHDGRVVEMGTHSELLNLKGHYYNLNKLHKI